MLLLFLILLIVLVDQAVKDAVEQTDTDSFPRELQPGGGLFTLYKSHNPGLPFGHLSRFPRLVIQIPLAVTSAAAGIFMWLLPKKGYRMQKLGLALTIGGGIGNLYDRLKRGYVVDYLSVGKQKKNRIILYVK